MSEKIKVLVAIPTRTFTTADDPMFDNTKRMLSDAEVIAPGVEFDVTILSGGNVARSRNKIIAYALRNRYRWVVFKDDDIEATAHDLVRLISHRAYVVGGLYTKRCKGGDLVLNQFREAVTDPATGLLPIGEIGCGFKAYHINVFRYLIKKCPELAYVSEDDGTTEYGFFCMAVRQVDGKSRWLPEDFWLDQLCRDHGVIVYADTMVKVMHRDTDGTLYPIDGKFPALNQPEDCPPPEPPSLVGEMLFRGFHPGRFVIALQYWDGDRDDAIRLARFIADIEPCWNDRVTMCFVRRHDATPIDQQTIKYVEHKFSVNHHVSPTHKAGYPDSPNIMAVALIREAARRYHGQWRDVMGVMLLESDSVPVKRGWLVDLIDEWQVALGHGRLLMGAWKPTCGPHGHINGNMVFHPSLADTLKLPQCPSVIPWDTFYPPIFRRVWAWTGLIANFYREVCCTDQFLSTPECGAKPPVLIHGVKDDSAWNYAERMTT